MIVDKKQVVRRVLNPGQKVDKVSISSDLQKLHYSEAGKTPHESDLGEQKSLKSNYITPYMNNVSKNVNNAMAYRPFEDKKPEFEAEKYEYKGKDDTQLAARTTKATTKAPTAATSVVGRAPKQAQAAPQPVQASKKQHKRGKSDATAALPKKQVNSGYVPAAF